ncbi:MAG TPA: methyltransferase [Micromonosporaceae bacterium]|nr:methyltransferase [Micromonosporaceae bacterium]
MTKPTEQLPETEQFLPVIFGFALTQIAGTTARLGIPDLLDSPKTADELAAATGADPRCLQRLLRAATAVGVLGATDGGLFELTTVGRIFRSDSPWQAGLHDAMHSHLAVWRAWGALEEAVRSGQPAFDIVNGMGVFDYLQRDAKLAGYFHATMATGTAAQLPSILANYDFSRFSRVVDVGGGNGTFLAAVLAANPGLRGTLFNAEDGLAETPEILRQAGVADRCDIVAGNFFESVPAGADAYLLKSVLHDWDDESCQRILRNCRDAMGPDGRVVVLTSLMPEGKATEDPGEALAVAIQDIEMMVMCPGAIRTLAEHERLFANAGLRLGEARSLSCPFLFHAVEGLPA